MLAASKKVCDREKELKKESESECGWYISRNMERILAEGDDIAQVETVQDVEVLGAL